MQQLADQQTAKNWQEKMPVSGERFKIVMVQTGEKRHGGFQQKAEQVNHQTSNDTHQNAQHGHG